MYFKKNEIIELSGGKKHLIVDTLQFEGTNYYYVCEVVNGESSIVPNFKVIKTIEENGNIFVKTIKDELSNKLTAMFKENLNIN